ncbi:aromatic ring-hydroxylating dioxygenase subunit alpha [Pseudonocardia eucalypti]|uniref:Aromatic ring-hydroxylating dioxygenase subunit alpha n=1 Tax=Pseudonocardia eucalypti TaxID=648755 RepID=A0ABP9RCW3_9PSEU|nr:vanillate O-demethylase monooxygenase subunit [Pseudonocardia eucalypti]
MKPNYPFNCWYVAATSEEVGRRPLGRRLLDVPVVLYRTGAGAVVAMRDRCVHRAYPLSSGHLEGDRVVCGYHGFAYDPDGVCVDVPSQENPPIGARVRTFPVFERGPLVWIWLGQPGAAALRTPPATPWLTDPGWASFGERLHVGANYLLLHEHYLDLTNVFAMHPANVPPGIDRLPYLDEVEVSEMSVRYTRALPPARLAPWEAEATGLPRGPEYHRREQGTFVSPALHVQRWVIDTEQGDSYEQLRMHGFTPETPTTTHVFLRVARNYSTDRALVSDHLRGFFLDMIGRDAAVLEVVQRQLAEEGEPGRDINVKADRAAVRARRVAQAMVAEETGRPLPRTPTNAIARS